MQDELSGARLWECEIFLLKSCDKITELNFAKSPSELGAGEYDFLLHLKFIGVISKLYLRPQVKWSLSGLLYVLENVAKMCAINLFIQSLNSDLDYLTFERL